VPFAQHLLEQAGWLSQAAPGDRGAPRQADLCRAASTAYYALFRFLIDKACDQLLGVTAIPSHRGVLARAFTHGQMKQACIQFSAKALPAALKPAAPAGGVNADLQGLCQSFVKLQERRHQADYDRNARFTRSSVAAIIAEARAAMAAWTRVPSPEAQLFAIAMLAGDRIRS
jgi:hypothetical protein